MSCQFKLLKEGSQTHHTRPLASGATHIASSLRHTPGSETETTSCMPLRSPELLPSAWPRIVLEVFVQILHLINAIYSTVSLFQIFTVPFPLKMALSPYLIRRLVMNPQSMQIVGWCGWQIESISTILYKHPTSLMMGLTFGPSLLSFLSFVSCTHQSLRIWTSSELKAASMIILPRDGSYELPWWERGNLSTIPPPPGYTSNFLNPPSKASWDVVTQVVCLTLATLLVAMRMYTKLKVLKNPGSDDCELHILQTMRLPGLTTF